MNEERSDGLRKSNHRLFLGIGIVFLCVIFFFFFTIYSWRLTEAASAPSIITYQGKLLVNNLSATTTQSVKFVLYDALTAGNVLYTAGGTTGSPTAISVTPSSGIFSVDLGGTGTNSLSSDIFRDNASVYLEVRVGSETLIPRKQITAVPYAFNAKYLDGVGTKTVSTTTYIPVSASDGSFQFNTTTLATTTLSGPLTIGTSTSYLQGRFYVDSSGNVSATGTFQVFGTSTLRDFTNIIGKVGNPTHQGSLLNGSGSAPYLRTPYSVFVSGNYAYVPTYLDDALEIIDISNPASPVHKGSIVNGAGGALLNGAYSVFVSGNYAYVASYVNKALEIIDISNPANPVHKGSLANGAGGAALNGPKSVFVSGNYAYVASYDGDTLEIVDISNPANPVHKGSLANGAGGAALDGATSVFVSGNYAYVASYDGDTLEIVDISNPANPVHKGSITDGIGAAPYLDAVNSVFVSGNYAYLASYNSAALEIIDISNPANPVHKGSIVNDAGGATLNGATSVFVSGNYAYVTAETSNALEIVDVSSSTAPVHKGSLAHGTGGSLLSGPQSVFISGNYAYVVSFTSNALEIVDVSGVQISNARIGSLLVDTLQTSNFAQFNQGLLVHDGLSVGGNTQLFGDVSIGGGAATTSRAVASSSLSVWGGLNIGISSSTDKNRFQLFISASSTTAKPLAIRGFLGQTGNLTEWYNSTDKLLSYFDNNAELFISAGGTATSTLTSSTLMLGKQSSFNSGKFYIDSSGNVSASGSLYTFGNVTSTGIIYGAGGLISSASSTFASNLQITGNIRASSTLLVGTAAGTDNFFVNGNNSYIATSTTYGTAYSLVVGNGTTGAVVAGGHISPSHTALFDLGRSGLAFNNLYTSSTIYTGAGGTTLSTLSANNLAFAGSTGIVSSTAGNLRIAADGANELSFWTNATKRAYIDSSGNIFASGTLQSTGSFISYGNVTSTGILYATNGLIADQTSGYNLGKFYVDSSGNVSASGSVYTFGNVTSTGILYATNGLISSASSTFSNDLYIAGNLDIGAEGSGISQLYVKASSTTAVPLIVRGSTGGAGTSYDYLTKWQDSSGNVIASLATSTQTVTLSTNEATALANTTWLSIGANSRMGILDILGSGAILLRNESGIIKGQVTNDAIDLAYDTGGTDNATSTYASNYLRLFAKTGYNRGMFYVDSSGNVSASGTLTLAGLTYTFPSSQSANYYLQTNGSGVLSWAAVSGGVSNPVTLTDGVTTSTLSASYLAIATSTSNLLGKFYADSLGNVSASGTLSVWGGVSTTSTVVSSTSFTFAKGTGYNSGLFNIDSSGNVSASGTLTAFGHLLPGTDNLYDIGASSTQWRYLNLQGGLLVANGTTTSTLLNNALTLGQTSSYNQGKFYVDSVGNVSATGTLSVWGGQGMVSSTVVSSTSFTLGKGAGYNSGVFAIDSSGNVSTSGTLNVAGGPNPIGSVANPVHKGSLVNGAGGALLNGAQSVFVSGDYAYVASQNSDALEIINISTSSPTHAGKITNGTGGALLDDPFGVFVSGNYAYVTAQTSDALEIIDVSNPANPVHKGSIAKSATVLLDAPESVFVSGNYAYVAANTSDALEIVDVSNPANPVHKGSIASSTTNLLDGPYSVFVSGNYAYVVSNISDALEIVDVSNPANPVHKGSIANGTGGALLDGPYSVFVSGNYAYVASYYSSALEIIDVSNPASPSHAGSLSNGTGGARLLNPYSVFVSGNYAYVVVEGGQNLEIIDISNPASPTHKSSLSNGAGGALLSAPRSIFVSGNYAYVAENSDDALEIIDVSGLIVSNLAAGTIKADNLQIMNFAQLNDGLLIRSGLNVGGNTQLFGDVSIGGGRATSTNMAGGGLTFVTNQTSSTITSRVFDASGSTGFIFNSGTSTWTGSDRNLVSFQTGGTDKFLFAADGSMIVNKASGYNLGKFYVDSSGNVSASGSLYTFGNVTSTGILYATNGLISSASSTFSNDLYIAGNLDIGAEGSGISQLYLNASSTTAVPLIIRGQTGGSATSYDYLTKWQDSSGNDVLTIATSTQSITLPASPGSPITLAETAWLTLGTNSRSGVIDIKGNTAALAIRDVNGMIKSTVLGDRIYVSSSGLVTSTYAVNWIEFYKSSGYNKGVFYLDSSGNVSASGSLYTFGNVTSTGILYATGGLISSASSTFSNDLYIAGNLDIGAEGNGLSQLYLKATSTTAVPLIIRGSTGNGGAGPAYYDYLTKWQDSSGNVIAFLATSTQTVTLPTNETMSLANTAWLSIGTNSRIGILDILGSGAIILRNESGIIKNIITNDSIDLAYDVGGTDNVTSTYASNYLRLFAKTGFNRGKFYVDSSGNVSASGTLTVWGSQTASSTILDSDELIYGKGTNYDKGVFYINGSGNISTSGTLAVNGLSNGSVTSTINTSLNVGSDSFIYDASTTITSITSLELGSQSFADDAGMVSWINLPITTTTANIANSFTASIDDNELLTLYGTSDSAGNATNLGVAIATSTAWDIFDINHYFTVASTTGNTNVSGTLRVWGAASTGGLLISATNSTTTLKSFASGAGAGAFIFDTNSTLTIASSSVLLSVRNNGAKVFSIDTSGAVTASGTFWSAGSPGDVAEFVELAPSEQAEYGDVLVVDTALSNKYRKSSSAYAKNVAGVISDTGKFIIGSERDGWVPLALAGLVKVKVTNENGPIVVGDYLVTASKSGYAMKYDPASGKPAGLVGMALEPLASGEGKIMLMVNKGFVDGASNSVTNLTVNENSSGQLVQNTDLDMAGMSIINLKGINTEADKWMIDEDGYLAIKIDTAQGEKRLYSLSSGKGKEIIFSSSSQLKAGIQKIEFELIDREIIDQNEPIKVIVTLTSGEASGIFVSEKTYQGFTVKELNNGGSDATFDWMVIAKRKPTNASDTNNTNSEPSVPSEPAPSEPAPTEPAPSEPAPAETTSSSESTPPADTTPPAEVLPSEPAPSEPAPTEPVLTEPTPSEPAPSEPAPSEPAPSESAPTE